MNAAVLVVLKILAVLALVLLNGFFVAAEFALVRIRETELDSLATKNQLNAKTARLIARNLNSYLSATQLGITMASLGLGWLGQPVFASLFSPPLKMFGIHSPALLNSLSFFVGFTLLTFLHITAGELAPKWFTIQKPLPVALWSAVPLRVFYLAFYPFNWQEASAAQLISYQAQRPRVLAARDVAAHAVRHRVFPPATLWRFAKIARPGIPGTVAKSACA